MGKPLTQLLSNHSVYTLVIPSSSAVSERSAGIITLFDAKGLLVPMSQRDILQSTCNTQNPSAGCNLNTQSGAKGH